MANTYGKKYPGSGTTPPFRSGPDFHPMPDGMVERQPVTEKQTVQSCETVHESPGFLRRTLGLPGRETIRCIEQEVDVVVGERVIKHYR